MDRHYRFIGGDRGRWRVRRIDAVIGASLDAVARLEVRSSLQLESATAGTWALRGFTSNVRYAERDEVTALRAVQEGLNRPEARCAALIRIRKNAAWWALAQDERREIFERQSRHTRLGLDYLPAIARQLHHSRDLGEPFDFLTWFEFAPEHTADFDRLVAQLRETPEWAYVDREVDIRLELDGA